MRKHDQAGQYGFNVEPELLAHDLALLKLSKRDDLQNMGSHTLYDLYTQTLNEMETEVADRTRYDKPLSELLSSK
ncbi:MAG: hypothetical protein HFG27_08380 [Provencibacterium sp.]|jgi:hypothetical protein|nr:hypothetical protein [Provencibacterium sp.]